MITRPVNEDLRNEYQTHIERYHRQTANMSFPQIKHPDFQALRDLGQPIIPLLLEDLLYQRHEHEAFVLLGIMTGQSPVNNQDRGKLKQMRLAWIEWGIRERYLEPPCHTTTKSLGQRLWEHIWKRGKGTRIQRCKILTNFFHLLVDEEVLRYPNGDVWHGTEAEAKTKRDELEG